MFALLLSDEGWLNATNTLLGIVVTLAVVAIASAVFHDIMLKVRSRAQVRQHFVFGDHVADIPGLGLTMADGGEPVKDDDPELKH